jgi:alpha-1,2-mannosyltransferase
MSLSLSQSLYDNLIVPGAILIVLPAIITTCLVLPLVWVWHTSRRWKNHPRTKNPKSFAFFHPHASGGGGGERVLWKMVQILQQQQQHPHIVIYTLDPPETCSDTTKLRQDVKRRFDVIIEHPVTLISLDEYKDNLLPSPYLSMVLESWGTMKLAAAALTKFQPDVFCDTTGCAFTFLVVRWMLPTAYILAYVHYPTISTDMMAWEWKQQQQQPQPSERGRGPLQSVRPKWKTVLKLVYYWMFAVAYGLVGSLSDLVLVNSTWTYNHIKSLWRFSNQIHIVYPPCRVPSEANNDNNNNDTKRTNTIVSIGQFRPEKDHALQIEALARLFELYPQHKQKDDAVKLLLIGSCRNDDDQQRVDALKRLVRDCNVQDAVEFSINPPYSELQDSMRTASMGIHTMRQEHFGIGIVEMMAAGLLTIAHNSGGPQTDIIVEPGVTGFLATTADEYAKAIHEGLTMTNPNGMRQKAQTSATRFSDRVFEESFQRVLPKLTEP